MVGLAVAEREKADKKPRGDKEKFSASVKLKPEFKEALEGYAKELGIPPGQFIEDRLGQLVRAEWKRILAEKLKRAQQNS